ncbi:MAG: NAD(P)H-dependent oxidoreductase [Anaerolineales bacterium]
MSEQPLEEPIRVVGFCGSLRTGSYSRMAINIALQGAAEMGADTNTIDLGDYDLVFCDGRHDKTTYPEGVQRLRRDVKSAQGIIIGTPEYHGSISGVLKNALDLMGFDEFEGRMLGLIGVSAGMMGAVHPLNSLRTIGRALRAWVIPQQVIIPQAWKIFDQQGNLQDEALEQRLKDIGREVTRFAYLHHYHKTREFLNLWETAQPNPGAE